MTGSTDCSVAGGHEYFVTGVAMCLGAGGHECFGAGVAEYFVAGGTEYFMGTFLDGSAYCHLNFPHAPPHSCKWGNAVPMSTFLQPA